MTSRDGLRRVLIVRMSSVGDIVLTEPVVAALAESIPGVEIGFALKARFADLVSGNCAISRVHLLAEGVRGSLSSLCRDVRVARYDAVVDLHHNARSVLIGIRSGARVRTAYRKRDLYDTLRVRFCGGTFRAKRRLVDLYLDALRPLGIDAPYRRPVFHLPAGARDAARARITDAGLRPGAYAALVPGAVWATKRWPAESFSEVARRLAQELGLTPVLLGTASERTLCEEVASGAGGVVLAGETGLGETAAFISMARVYVGNDSGPTHISMALGTPTVAIFGPTDPGQFDHEGHELVYTDPGCGACSFFGGTRCRHEHWECMRSISAGRVFEAAARLAEGQESRG